MRNFTLAASLGLSLVSLPAAPAGDWSAFRGPNSSGVSTTARPPVNFGPGTNVIWQTDVPASPSSPVVWRERIFLTTLAEGRLETRCYGTKDGKLIWSKAAPITKMEAFHATEGSPAASSPATDGTRVVSYFGSGGVFCYDLQGKELWSHPLPTAQTGGDFGSGTSPVLAEGLVLVNRDQLKDSTLLALDAKTGKKVWETPRPDSGTSYGTPILLRSGGATLVVVAGSVTAKAYDLKTGASRWLVRGLPSFNCTTPVLAEDLLVVAGWSPGKSDSPWPKWESTLKEGDKNGDGVITLEEFDPGARAFFNSQDIDKDGKLTKKDWDTMEEMMAKGENQMLAIRPDGSGDITESNIVWKFERGLPYVPSPLYYQGRVYLVKDGGMLSSFDAKTGKVFYQQERLNAQGTYYASPVAADGHIYVASLMKGKVSVIKAGGELPEILHQVEFGERIAATPALVGERIYVRTATKLYAFGNPAKQTAAR